MIQKKFLLFICLITSYIQNMEEFIKKSNDDALWQLRTSIINSDELNVGYICAKAEQVLFHNDKLSPLCLATRFNNMRIASFFLLHGANPNVEGIDGIPIHHACMFRNIPLFNLLRNFNADSLQRESNAKNTPMHTLFKSRIFTQFTKEQIDILTSLLAHGCDPNQQNEEQQTPLHELLDYAKENNKLLDKDQKALCKQLIDILLQAKANIHIPNTYKKTPLDLALDLNFEVAAYMVFQYENGHPANDYAHP